MHALLRIGQSFPITVFARINDCRLAREVTTIAVRTRLTGGHLEVHTRQSVVADNDLPFQLITLNHSFTISSPRRNRDLDDRTVLTNERKPVRKTARDIFPDTRQKNSSGSSGRMYRDQRTAP
jgi:hypothetical protein